MKRLFKLLTYLICLTILCSLISLTTAPSPVLASSMPRPTSNNSTGHLINSVQQTRSPTVTFSWYVDDSIVTLAPKSGTVDARVVISNALNGHYILYVWRDISWDFDETVASLGFDYPGGSLTEDLAFVPIYATGEASTNGYYMELVQSTPSQNTWDMANAYPPRLRVGYALTVQVNPPGAGTVTISSPPQQTSSSWSNTYSANASVSISASPNNGFKFIGWTGALSGDTIPQTITMTANQTVTAKFDSIGLYKISDAWITNAVDNDNDGYLSQFVLNWGTASNNKSITQLEAQVYLVAPYSQRNHSD